MKRRLFLACLGVAVMPIGARAQSTALPRIGFLNSTSPEVYAFNAEAFRDGLREAGYIDGHNVGIDYRWASGVYDRLPALAVELVERKVAVIAATGDIASALAAKKATATIPIVFTVGSDPIRFGLVRTLSRPGGNATGITLFSSTLMEKRMEVLNELIPRSATIALLMNPENANATVDQERAREAAQALGRSTFVVNARGAGDLEAAFASIRQQRGGAVLLASDPTFLGLRNELAAAAARYAIPVMYWTRDFALAGGLVSYGTSITWMYRQAGVYCGQILKGARPGELPVLQPTTFELVINMKAARALGISVPQALLVRADDVIQ